MVRARSLRRSRSAGRARPAPTPEDRAEAESRLTQAETRLAEADETLRALRHGEVDALVVRTGVPDVEVFTLSSADRPYRMFVESMNDGAATVSPEGTVLYANPRLVAMLAYPVHEIVGAQMASFVAPAARRLLTPGPGPTATVEVDLMPGSGRPVAVLLGTSWLDVDGDEMACLTFTDLTAQKLQEEEIGRLNRLQSDQLESLRVAQSALILKATHDSLTALPNRALLIDRIEQALSRGLRTGRWTAALFVDLDHFKHINDNRGHAAGDDALRQVADFLQRATRPMDTVARIGGDEFVVLAPDLVDQMEAVHIAGRLAEDLAHHFDGGDDREQVTASIGIAVAGAGAGGAEQMLHEADIALYHAKARGRNRAEVFDVALSREARLRAATEESIRRALDESRLIPHYQPIVDLSTGRVAGFEALARIRTSDDRLLTPDTFIGVAEESGLVVPLGAQMLSAACREARRWDRGGPAQTAPTVAVNLSPRQLEGSDLLEQIRVALSEAGLAPDRLHLEITETALIELRPEVIRQLDRIRDLGVEIGLDDFGTGYASLTHLRRLPLGFVKIDRSFISGLGADIQDERIVGAVIELAANLGLRSIAEGIETPRQLDRLRELGCEHAQGYLFARPGPGAEPGRTYSTSGSDYPVAGYLSV